MSDLLFILFVSLAIGIAVAVIAQRRGRKVRTIGIATRAERDAKIYYELIDSKASKLIYPSVLSARLPSGEISLALSLIALAFISYAALEAIESKEAQASLIIPGVTVKTRFGIFGLIVAIAYAVIVHESAHAFSGILRGSEPKKTGIVTIGPFLLAYVSFEDEENLSADVAGAGVVSNIITGLSFLVAIYIISSLLAPYASGVVITSGPSYLVGKVIVAVNGESVRNVQEFLSIRNSIPEGSKAILLTSSGEKIEIVKGSVRFGISNRYFSGYSSYLVAAILATLFRSYVVNISLGLINALPILGLDGSRVLYVSLKEKLSERALLSLLLASTAYSILVLMIMISP